MLGKAPVVQTHFMHPVLQNTFPFFNPDQSGAFYALAWCHRTKSCGSYNKFKPKIRKHCSSRMQVAAVKREHCVSWLNGAITNTIMITPKQ